MSLCKLDADASSNQSESSESSIKSSIKSSIWIYRHADRIDEEDPTWFFKANYEMDPPLSPSGFETGKRMGLFIWNTEKDRLLTYNDLIDIKLFSSPFSRCLQTSYHIANTIEKLWSQETNKIASGQIKICIEYGLAEDIPDRTIYDPNEIVTKRDLVTKYLNPDIDTEIIERLDTEYQSKYKPEDRLTYVPKEEYLNRVNDIYNYLMKLGHHTVLISSHLDETHEAYRQITNINVPERNRYGVMANFVNPELLTIDELFNKNQRHNSWQIRHHLWDHHQHKTLK